MNSNWMRKPGGSRAQSTVIPVDLRRQCLLDASTRLRGGVFVYAIYWLIATLPTGLHERQPAFVFGNFLGLTALGVLRYALDKALPSMVVDQLPRATMLFRVLPICNGVYWGALTAIALLWSEGQPIKHFLVTISIGMVIAGAMTMAIDPVLRLVFPVAVITPGTVGLLLNLNVENGVFAMLSITFVLPLARLSRVVHDDYWYGAHARRELQERAAEFEVLSLTDTLTQVPNRRFFDQQLQTEWALSCRLDVPMALAMVDLDHFKRINDNYGHPLGDQCLRATAAALEQALHRPSDVVARYGGEEFVVLLPHTDAAGAHDVAQHLLRSVAALSLEHEGKRVNVTCSIGVCAMRPSTAHSPAQMVQLADEALYQAKNQGRNRVVMTGANPNENAQNHIPP